MVIPIYFEKVYEFLALYSNFVTLLENLTVLMATELNFMRELNCIIKFAVEILGFHKLLLQKFLLTWVQERGKILVHRRSTLTFTYCCFIPNSRRADTLLLPVRCSIFHFSDLNAIQFTINCNMFNTIVSHSFYFTFCD